MQPTQAPSGEASGQKQFIRHLLRVRDRLMRDGNLTAAERLVGWYIFWRVNKKSRDAWPSHETIADDLHISLKTAKRATLALRKANYITCELDGRFNRYRPVLPEPVVVGGEKDRIQGPADIAPAGTIGPLPGSFCPPLGTINPGDRDQNDPLSPKVRTPRTESLTPTPSTQAIQAWVPDHQFSDPFWTRTSNRLEQVIGPHSFRSWFKEVSVLDRSDTCIILSAPSRFIAREIGNRFGGLLVHCVRCELPTIQRIQIEVDNVRLDIRSG